MTLLIVYLFSVDTLKHEQPDAWLMSQFLVLSICGHLSDKTCNETNTKCSKAGGATQVSERLPAEWEVHCNSSL